MKTKKICSVLLCLLLGISSLTFPSHAVTVSGVLSTGLKNLTADYGMIKSGLVAGQITFSAEDFDNAVGCNVKSITVTSLPSSSDGVLLYNGGAVTVNQTINRKGLASLCYSPVSTGNDASFRFRTTDFYSIECTLRYTDSVNLSPTVSLSVTDLPVWTQEDIKVFGKLSGSDPDGDRLSFEITEYPQKGLLNLLDKENGSYSYTPCEGVTGNDSFIYRVRDEWGNYSEEQTVSVRIDTPYAEYVFADLNDHWAQNAAVVLTSVDAFDYEETNGSLYFKPEEEMTREDFLVAVMKTFGCNNITSEKTLFADDEQIESENKGYIARAHSLGIIQGQKVNGLSYFYPKNSITRAEAAVILNTIIGAEERDSVSVFADSDSIPTWAKTSLSALSSCGIINGTDEGAVNPNSNVTRAQAAQMLLEVKRRYT